MEKYRKSQFVFPIRASHRHVLYHSLLIKKIIGGKLLLEVFESFKKPVSPDEILSKYKNKAQVRQVLELLIANKFIIRAAKEDKIILDSLRKKIMPNIKILYLVPTSRCNFRCKYCSIMHNNKGGSDMSEHRAKKAIDLFFSCLKDRNGKIIFYGGEPLMNFELVKWAVAYIRKKEKLMKKEINIVIISNGSMLTEEIIRFIKKNSISLSISLDGLKSNNGMRVYENNKETFDDVIRGIKLLKKNKISFGLSCTFSAHNVPDISRVSKFICSMGIKGLGFNLLKNLPNGLPTGCSMKDQNRALIKAFKIFRKKGIYEDRIMRKIKAFINEKPHLADCSAYGGQIVVAPEGNVGLCHTLLLNSRQTSIGNVSSLTRNKILRNKRFLQWSKISPLFRKECLSCYAIGICGNGCAAEAMRKTSSLNGLDEGFCEHTKGMLSWLIQSVSRGSK
jgi:uncharacterized protein